MNKKFFLTLLSSPVLFSSIVSMAVFTQPASANQINPTNSAPSQFSCGQKATVAVATPSLSCTRLNNRQKNLGPNELPELEFTEEESDAAIALFGCDCPSCLNAMRSIRGLPPAV